MTASKNGDVAHTAPVQDTSTAAFDLSVIISLAGHRGHAVDCVKSWVQHQSYPQDNYEIIVVGGGREPEIDALVKNLLRSQDRLLEHQSGNEFCSFDAGAREARGRILFFTEGHCIGEKNCLEELVRFLNDSDYVGGSLGSKGICTNYVGELEDRLFQEQVPTWSPEGHWRKITLRGFALYSSVFWQVGGFEHQYGLFTERALAVRLHQSGFKMGYAQDARVFHFNMTKLTDLFPSVKSFVFGELLYRSSFRRKDCEEFFGRSQEWTDRESFRRGPAALQVRALRHYLLGNWRSVASLPMHVSLVTHLLSLTLVSLFGLRLALVRARLAMYVAAWRTRFWHNFSETRCLSAFREYWFGCVIRYYRLLFLSERQERSSAPTSEQRRYQMQDLPEEALIGFFDSEEEKGRTFRWSKCVAAVRVVLPRENYQLDVRMLKLRPDGTNGKLRLYFNGHKLAGRGNTRDENLLSYALPSFWFRRENFVILVCKPFVPAKLGSDDRRQLGVPVCSLEFREDVLASLPEPLAFPQPQPRASGST